MKPRQHCSASVTTLTAVVLLAATGLADAAVSVDVTCNTAICEEQLADTPCATLPEQCRNGSGVILPYPGVCNCCEYCLTYLNEGEVCTIGMPGRPLPTAICGPGLSCYNQSDGEPICKSMNTTCAREQVEYDDAEDAATLGVASWRPRCDGDGYYAPAHCVPNGLCYCVEKHSRGRIFGENVFSSLNDQRAMTCGCSRATWTAEQLLGRRQVQVAGTGRCTPDGSFDELQCVAGTCVCVNATTGELLESAGSVDVNDLVASSLPCFDRKRHREGGWETDCERERRLAFQDLSQLEADGVVGVGAQPPACDPDGSYSRVQTRNARKMCVDSKGRVIGDYSVPLSSELAATMDCNCARTRLLLEAEGRVDGQPMCCASGDFLAWQCWRGRCYCVDGQGAQTTADVPIGQLAALPCWSVTEHDTCAFDDGFYPTPIEETTEQTSTEGSTTTEGGTTEA